MKDFYVRRISQLAQELTPPPLTYSALNPYLLLEQSLPMGVTYHFGALKAITVAQTTGEGATAQITIDPTAAGHGWYIDATPLDNTDD